MGELMGRAEECLLQDVMLELLAEPLPRSEPEAPLD